ncbi:MAG: ABC transporter substrate-binding protein [Gammaproteobacteria bacterium]|nr:ABC transporter substrate-binding protein [Gammaproteobacteria bacterium]
MKRIILLPIGLIVLAMVLTSAGHPDFSAMAERRLVYARQAQGDIEIVAFKTPNEQPFINGVLLAAEQINNRPGKLLGRKLKVHIETEGDSFKQSKATLRGIVANPRITAVLGHPRSDIAVPASMMYELGQMVFLSAFAIAETLTGHNFQYVFRMAPGAQVMASQFADIAANLGYRKVVLLYGRSSINRELAFRFEDAAIEQDIHVIKRVSFFDKETNHRPVISQFSNEDFDAVFIASSSAAGGVMVRQLREMGVEQPIIGNSDLARANYYDTAGEAANNTVVPTLLHRTRGLTKANQNFIQQYQARYHHPPNHNAAQGYDSMTLLASAIERAGSTLPPLLASTLHYMPAWAGVTGIHAFDDSGEILGKRYVFSVWRDGELHELPAIHVPYLLQRFAKSVEEQHGTKITDFSQRFGRRLHDDDHKLYLLELAYELLRFQRLGIIYENTKHGRKAANLALIKSVASKKDFDVIECEIPFSLLKEAQVTQSLIDCYGKLSLKIDALLVSDYPYSDSNLIKHLNEGLAFYKIPAIAIANRNSDPNVSVLLTKRSDIKQHNAEAMRVYNGLLRGLKVHELSDRLQGLPEISLNLAALQHSGLSDRPFLKLSADGYHHSDGLFVLPGEKP